MRDQRWSVPHWLVWGNLCSVAYIVLLTSCSSSSPSPVVSPGRCGFPASGVLASWGQPQIHKIAANGKESAPKRWHVSLWLPERPTKRRRQYHMSCATSPPLSMVLAAKRPATFVLVSSRGGQPNHLQLGHGTLTAPAAAPLRETSTREVMRKIPPFSTRLSATYLFAFPPLDQSWSQLEFRVPIQGSGDHLRVRFKRKPCANNAAN